jgi:Trypsin
VVVLDHAISSPTPATLAATNYLDQFAEPALNQTIFSVVGYGTEVRKPDSGPQKPQPMSFPIERRFTTSPGQKLTPQILQLNGNENDIRGGGGTCFGDSGGPVFLNGFLVGVTSYGYTSNCRYLDGYQRVEIPVVQSWLATVG